MAVPDFQTLMLPLLEVAGDGQPHNLYLGQLPAILFASDVQQEARTRFGGAQDPRPRLLAAVSQIVPVRNEIAHVREIDRDRLLRATVACADILEMLRSKG